MVIYGRQEPIDEELFLHVNLARDEQEVGGTMLLWTF